ncbi:hypothetical protein [Variovorax guangxiensis]|nr:hypothetical protein [Variovorax guangxiensis]MDR6856243.1 lipopolysaccharide/colanic/teichoic acid biosynthesis glycosyltransferase [Variovorax guangxiensis]
MRALPIFFSAPGGKLDVAYLDRWSLGLDLVILARTLRAVLAGGG